MTINAGYLRFDDVPRDIGVFYGWPRTAQMELFDRYRPFACPGCGKIDRNKAIEAGFEPKLIDQLRRIKLDAFSTRDIQDIVSRELFRFLSKHFPKEVAGSAIPGTNYALLLPRRPVTPPLHVKKIPKDSPFRVAGKPCPKCGRQHWAGSLYYNVYLPRGAQLMAIAHEDEDRGAFTAWVLGEEAQELLKQHKWKGLRVVPDYYGKDAPFHKRAQERQKKAVAKWKAKTALLKKKARR